MSQIPGVHPPVSSAVVSGSVTVSVVVVAELVPLSAVAGPALVSAVVTDDEPPLEYPDEPPVLAVSVGEKGHPTKRMPASASHLAVAVPRRPPSSSATSPTPSGPPRQISVIRMLPND